MHFGPMFGRLTGPVTGLLTATWFTLATLFPLGPARLFLPAQWRDSLHERFTKTYCFRAVTWFLLGVAGGGDGIVSRCLGWLLDKVSGRVSRRRGVVPPSSVLVYIPLKTARRALVQRCRLNNCWDALAEELGLFPAGGFSGALVHKFARLGAAKREAALTRSLAKAAKFGESADEPASAARSEREKKAKGTTSARSGAVHVADERPGPKIINADEMNDDVVELVSEKRKKKGPADEGETATPAAKIKVGAEALAEVLLRECAKQGLVVSRADAFSARAFSTRGAEKSAAEGAGKAKPDGFCSGNSSGSAQSSKTKDNKGDKGNKGAQGSAQGSAPQESAQGSPDSGTVAAKAQGHLSTLGRPRVRAALQRRLLRALFSSNLPALCSSEQNDDRENQTALVEAEFRRQLTETNVRGKPLTRQLFLSNHPTRLDWAFLWAFFAGSDTLHALKIAMKDMSKVPVFGWGCAAFSFIFLKRTDRDADLAVIQRNLKTQLGLGGNSSSGNARDVALLLFPEGTDLSPSNRAKSHAFAQEKGLPLWNRVLKPKSAGTVCAAQAMTGLIIDSFVVTEISNLLKLFRNKLG